MKTKSDRKKFYKFTEENDWEMETWHFFLLLDQKQHAKIKKAIAKLDKRDGPNPYRLSDQPIPENEVDILVKHSDVGYLAQYNKCAKIKLPVKIDLTKNNGDIFYKGKCWEQ